MRSIRARRPPGQESFGSRAPAPRSGRAPVHADLDLAPGAVPDVQTFGATDLDEAVEVANAFAPEHLCLLVCEPWAWVDRVRNAGAVFVGEAACEALGDYVAGPSHIMPTGGSARWSSPVSVRDFVRMTAVVGATTDAAAALAPTAVALAEAEALTAHAAALRRRS